MIDAKTAKGISEKAKDDLFLKEKEWVYKKITESAELGDNYYEYQFNKNIQRKDIQDFQRELEEQGFEVEFVANRRDELDIKWY